MFHYSTWLRTPLHKRSKIAEIFGIKKKKSTHVADNQVVDDGYYIQDVEEALSVPKLQEYLETDETETPILWKMLNDKLDGKIPDEVPTDFFDDNIHQAIADIKIDNTVTEVVMANKKNRGGRPKKNR